MYSSLSHTGSLNSAVLGTSGGFVLANDEAEAVLQFLPKQPAHCAYLTGLIHEHGLVSPLNRGTFYGSKNILGELRGVALVGHATIIEPTNNDSLRDLAEVASKCDSKRLVMCEDRWAEQFWKYHGTVDWSVNCERRELLLELRWPATLSDKHRQRLRLATSKDLELLIPVHARLASYQSGVDPRDADNEGFIERYRQRIRNGRTWVLTQDDQLIFKADVVTATPETCYLEGVWVNPNVRSMGYGRTCIAELARMLLWRSRCISVLVNDDDTEAQLFYKSCGFHVRGSYRTVFLAERNLNDND
jgi:predicted GNAT family acetyltransferase